MIITIDETKLAADFATWLCNISDDEIIAILKDKYNTKTVKQPVVQTTQLGMQSIAQSTAKSSVSLGVEGEQQVINVLSPLYELQFNAAHKGDMIVKKDGRSIMIEIKNYTNTVPYTEVDKFYSDLDCNASYIGGIFVSLKSKISKIDKAISFTKHNNQYVIFLSATDTNTLLAMTSLLFEIGCYTSVNCNKLVTAINDLDEIRSCINTCTNVFAESKALFDKNYNLFARKMESLNEKFNKLIVNLTSYIETNETVAEVAEALILERFPESLAAKNSIHMKYIRCFCKNVTNIKNKSTIECGDVKVDLLKTKTYLYISCDYISGIAIDVFLLYDVSIDAGVVKIEISGKNIPLLDRLTHLESVNHLVHGVNV